MQIWVNSRNAIYCKALFARCWSTIRKVSVWQSHDTDHIVNVVNNAQKLLGVSMYLTADDLPASTELHGHMFDVHFLGPGTWEMAIYNVFHSQRK